MDSPMTEWDPYPLSNPELSEKPSPLNIELSEYARRLSANMTKRQVACCEWWVATGNKWQSLVNAGYSEGTAGSGRKFTNLQKAYIAELNRILGSSPTICTAHERQEMLTEFVRDEEVPVQSKFQAMEMLNQMQGVYLQPQVNEGEVYDKIVFEHTFVRKTPDELNMDANLETH